MVKKKTTQEEQKEVLINSLLEILNIDEEFNNSIDEFLHLELEEILNERQFELIKLFSKTHFVKLINKKRTEYRKFYNQFDINELSDLIIFYKSSIGSKLKNKSLELQQINNIYLSTALDDGKLNTLIDNFLSVEVFNDTEDDE